MDSRLVRKPGFSLVELVIVVVIIGVIAAIAVPRISRGAKGAFEATVRANLHALRTAIDLYAAEHGGVWPGAAGSQSSFIDEITKKTDSVGNVVTTAGVHVYGPYLRRIPSLAVGPYPEATGIIMDSNVPLQVSENPEAGWVYNNKIGEIIPNTNDLDDNGVGYDTY